MLQKFTGVGSGSFEIEQASQGLIVKNIAIGAKLKIERVSKTDAPKQVYPELTAEEFVAIAKGVAKRSFIVQLNADGTAYEKIQILFSKNGALPLDEDVRYKVTATSLNNRATEFHNLDSSKVGFPIRVRKASIKQTTSEKVFDVPSTDMLFFPNELPTSLVHHVRTATVGMGGRRNLRKVEVLPEQITAYNDAFRITGQTLADEKYVLGNDKPVFPISKIQNLTISHAGNGDFDFYLLDLN